MSISNQVFIITRTVVKFPIKITHSVQVSNVTKPIIHLLWLTTVSSVIVTHFDDIVRITIAISNTMVIWTTVLAIIVTDFIEVDEVTFAIINQEVVLTVWRRFPNIQVIDVKWNCTLSMRSYNGGQKSDSHCISHPWIYFIVSLTLSTASLSQSQWCNRFQLRMTSC